MMAALRILARLLDWPDEHLWQHEQEMCQLLQEEASLQPAQRDALIDFIHTYLHQDLLDAQEQYCEQFDRGRATSLLLFEHVHGESRDRGQAMVDLLTQYEQAGLQLDSRELPDHLPVYLEYLSILPADQARRGLNDIAPILALVGERLQQRDHRFALLFDLLLQLSGSELTCAQFRQRVAREERDDTPAALDAVWEEEMVKFIQEPVCASSDMEKHQRRFAQRVVPHYLNLDAGAPQ